MSYNQDVYRNLRRRDRLGLVVGLAQWILLAALPLPCLLADESPPAPATAQAGKLTIDRIYGGSEFSEKSFAAKWLPAKDHAQPAFTTWQAAANGQPGQDLMRYEIDGSKSTMIAAAELIPPGQSQPLAVDDYHFSDDLNRVLLFTNSVRVWRDRTRGDYWVYDRSSRQLSQLGGSSPPASLMFAKFSPRGQEVAYVRERNIYVENLLDGTIRQVTQTASDEIINGTTDWVYEEELGLRDAFMWSSNGQHIAYWQVDTSGVPKFPLVNQTDALYPVVTWFAYPKVGQQNSSVRVGVANTHTLQTQWIDVPGDPREHYLPRMLRVPAASEESPDRWLVQQLNRLQNTNRLFVGNASQIAPVLTESDAAWVDVHDEIFWFPDGRFFTWLSERDGWRHVYVAELATGQLRQVTSGEFDVIELLHLDAADQAVYFIASPDAASERYLYRAHLDGSGLERLTPPDSAGTHQYSLAPDGRWAIHTFSSTEQPPVTELISLPDHAVVSTLEDNAALAGKLAKLDRRPVEFFRTDIGDGISLESFCLLPPDFDPQRKYPLLVYVYGEPAGTTVVNRWGGTSYLWHLMLAQRGYVVMSFDNRGTKAPRGRSWRKSIYQQIGIIPPQDQAAAARAVLEQRPYLDPQRVGIWGWSGGGSSSLHAIFKYPELYHTAIAVAPVPNQRYYDTIYQERYMSLPELNAQGFIEGSPINFAHQLQGNLLLIHGTGDDNCHYQTSEMLINELIAHNKQFSLMAYPNRSHAVREEANTTRHLRQLMTDYLLQHLPPDE